MSKAKTHTVPSVVKLAEAIGLSRQWVQELMRLPDAPRATRQGHDVNAWKSYIGHRAQKIQNESGQKARLHIDLLQARLAHEKHDLRVASGEVRQKIFHDVLDKVIRGVRMFNTALDHQLLADLPPRLSGESPGEIRKLLKARLDQARGVATKEFHDLCERENIENVDPDKNIVPFQARAAL